jgi:type I restriction enzyme, S subunit
MTAIHQTRNWRDGVLEDLVFFQRGFDITVAQQQPGPHPVISSSGVTSYHNEFMVNGPGIVIGRKGTLGSIHFTEVDYWPHDTTLWSKDLKGNVPLFVYYYLHTIDFKRFDVGNSNPTLNRNHIHGLKARTPPLVIQQRIADTLSAYDDLIENNRRRMALLEESARLLYQEWFVRLRFPGHEHVRIVSGLPEGWKRKALSEVAEFRLGKMLDQNKNKGDLMPYLANVNVRWGVFELNDLREMRFEDHELTTFGLKYGDIVMCEGGEPGRCAIWKEQMPGMMIQKAIHRIRASDNMHHIYLYYSLRHQGQTGQMATLFTGATIKHLPREKLEKVVIVTPPARLMDIFIEHVGPIENQLRLLQAANRRASEARDLLLPQLMSGEVAV